MIFDKYKNSGLVWLWLTIIIVILDQWTKFLAEANLIYLEQVPIVPSFNLMLAYNKGAAFSFLSDAGGWQRWFFTTITLIVSVAIIYWLYTLKFSQKWLAIALALILGGAIGNVWDRIQLGHVVDFVQLYYQSWYWPAFNIADAAICVGAVMLIIDTFRKQPEQS
ncbi:MAG: signal peptidase II [Gammaproteobacteria bacterium]|nr:signal peptidase II [Gammaproteobacteria bacterium]